MATSCQEGHTIVITTPRAAALILALAVAGNATMVVAQSGPPAQPRATALVAAPIAVPGTTADPNSVRLLAGRSTIVDVGMPIARVSLTSPDVADAMVTTPTQLLLNGKVPGTISMFVWDRGGALRRFEITVGRDLGPLHDQLRRLFPEEQLEVQSTGRNIVLSGHVTSKEVADKVASVASGYVATKDEVVSLLQVRQAPAARQVLLRVRFAEVSRSALTSLGASFYGDGAKNLIGRSTTGQFGQPAVFDQTSAMVGETQVFSDFLNLFLFSYKHQVGAVIKALQTKGLFQSLAEPNLVSESGKEASFLAGGEIPVPVVQGAGGNLAVSVMWKEFGIRLNFTPTVNGERVHLKVKPEVSTLDFGNAVTLQGFRIPALSTRRTETELELQDGQTFAIAGLMNNQVSSTMQKIPGIGDIPVLGALFRSKAAQKDQTELVVMITPEILRQESNGVTSDVPRTPERFMDPLSEKKTHPMPPAAFRRPAPGNTAAAASIEAPVRTPSAKSPEAAAATVSALTPHTRTVTHAPPPEPAPTAVLPLPEPSTLAVAPLVVREPLPGELEIDSETAELPSAVAPPVPPAPDVVDAGHETADRDRERQAKAATKAQQARQREARKAEKARQKQEARAAQEALERDKVEAKRAAQAARQQRELEEMLAKKQSANADGPANEQ
ncbi:MAG: type II and III secretion system protein family protein [Vicinamibacterales bacterium]